MDNQYNLIKDYRDLSQTEIDLINKVIEEVNDYREKEYVRLVSICSVAEQGQHDSWLPVGRENYRLAS